jgi:hypothetical protein
VKRANLFADAVGVDRGDVDGCASGLARTSTACDDRRGQRHNPGFHIFLPDIRFTQRDIDRNLQCGCQPDDVTPVSCVHRWLRDGTDNLFLREIAPELSGQGLRS